MSSPDVAAPFRLAVVLGLAAALAACATSPLGRSQLQLYSDEQMRAMGEQAFEAVRREKAEVPAGDVTAFVQCVASSIAETLDVRGIGWEVVVFDDEAVNAFALPGGKIGVYNGLLDVAENQHQLATVMGHEIGHVIARHANERLSTATMSEIGFQAAAAIAGGPSPQRDTALAALGLGLQVGVLLPFTRTQEEEADLIGLDLMATAGFDPRESVALWRNMAEHKEREPPEMLSTHPSSEGRIEALQERMPSAMQLYEATAGRRPDCGENPR